MALAEKDSDFQDIVERAKTQGWLVEKTKKNHWKFVPPNKESPVVNFSGSPSDWRSIRNFISTLRRSGFISAKR